MRGSRSTPSSSSSANAASPHPSLARSTFSSSRLNLFLLLFSLFLSQLFLSFPSSTAAPRFSSSSSSSSFRRRRDTSGVASTSGNGTRVTKVGSGAGFFDMISHEGKAVIINAEANLLRLYGFGFSADNFVKLDLVSADFGAECDHQIESDAFPVLVVDPEGYWAEVRVELPESQPKYVDRFLCVGKNDSSSSSASSVTHQGAEFDVVIQFRNRYSLPFGLQVFFLIVLLFMSGMFSGLNLGLMSLDITELQIVINCGTEKEKEYARKIQPIRKKGNYLLCTVLLSNVLVNSTLTILMDELTGGGGIIAIVGSTMGIVVFGEIIPQAVCSRHGLAVGAGTIWIMKFFMLATFPLSFPVSLLLDVVLGEEIGNVYSRDRLRELLKITASHHDIKKDEMKMITGALSLTEKTVKEVMTPLEDVFAVPMDAVLDFQTMSDIVKRGYTRIPIYEDVVSNIVGLLNIRDLAFVDPDDAIPLKTLCKFYQHSILSVHDDSKLDTMLNEFKEGQCHMALVETVNDSGQGDPFYEVMGLVTLEDIIEEIIQAEIVDETDVVVDNKKKILRTMPDGRRPNPEDFVDSGVGPKPGSRISPQLSLAVFQFLSAQVDPFSDHNLTPNILRRLIKKSEVFVELTHTDVKPVFIYEKDKPADFFCLILEGCVECRVGKDDMVYETGSFSSFGAQALVDILNREASFRGSRNSGGGGGGGGGGRGGAIRERCPSMSSIRRPVYVPDFSLKTSAPTQILKITRSHYLAARRASELEMKRFSKVDGGIGVIAGFDDQLEKVFNEEWKKTSEKRPRPLSTSSSSSKLDVPDMTMTPPETPREDGGVVNGGFVSAEDAVKVVGGGRGGDEEEDLNGRSRLI